MRSFLIEGKLARGTVSPVGFAACRDVWRETSRKTTTREEKWVVLHRVVHAANKTKRHEKTHTDLKSNYAARAYRIEPTLQCWVTALRVRMTSRNESKLWSLSMSRLEAWGVVYEPNGFISSFDDGE